MSVIDDLLAVQDHDIRIKRIEKELKDIPLRKKAEETRLSEHKKALEAAEADLKGKQAETKKEELETESLRQQINKLRQQQLELKTNKEFKAMDDEIRGVQGKITAIEDKELVMMEAVDAARKAIAEKQKALREEEALVGTDIKTLDERTAALNEELKKEKAVRDEIAAKVDSRWLSVYNIVSKRKEPALVSLEEGICGGCHLRLAPSVAHDAKKQASVVTCGFCGRMLY